MIKILSTFCFLCLVLNAAEPAPDGKPSIFSPPLGQTRKPLHEEPSEIEKKADALRSNLTEEYLRSLPDDAPVLFILYAERVFNGTAKPGSWADMVDRDIKSRKNAYALFKKLLGPDSPFTSSHAAACSWVRYNRPVPWKKSFLEDVIHSYQTRDKDWDWTEMDARHLAGLIASIGDEEHRKIILQMESEGAHVESEKRQLDNRLNHLKETQAVQTSPSDKTMGVFPKQQEQTITNLSVNSNQQSDSRHREWIVWILPLIAAAGVIIWFLRKDSK